MARHFGLGHYSKNHWPDPDPWVKRLGVALAVGAIVGLAAFLSPHPAPAATVTCGRFGCSDWHHVAHRSRHVDASGNRVLLGSRPDGCPHAWCGCGLARHLGLHDRRLWRAWAWEQIFPHTNARPGAVAVRRHHVMQLVRHIDGKRWLVRSYNDYRHKGWLVVRDVRGFVFVSPRGDQLARN